MSRATSPRIGRQNGHVGTGLSNEKSSRTARVACVVLIPFNSENGQLLVFKICSRVTFLLNKLPHSVMTSFYLLYTQYNEIMSNVYILLSVRNWVISLPFFEISSSNFWCKLIWPSPRGPTTLLLIETALPANFRPEHKYITTAQKTGIWQYLRDIWTFRYWAEISCVMSVDRVFSH